jgi:hypothetical protein
MLHSVFALHTASCKFSKDRAGRRCNCPEWVGGQVNGYYFRQSAKTRQWAEAEACRLKLEEALAKGAASLRARKLFPSLHRRESRALPAAGLPGSFAVIN